LRSSTTLMPRSASVTRCRYLAWVPSRLRTATFLGRPLSWPGVPDPTWGLCQRELDLSLLQQLDVLGGAAGFRRDRVDLGNILGNDGRHRRAHG
jgi:hypothetical protein